MQGECHQPIRARSNHGAPAVCRPESGGLGLKDQIHDVVCLLP